MGPRLLCALALCLGLGLVAGPGRAAPASADEAQALRDRTLIKRLWGVEVMGVRWSAGGYMLELRYKVLDAGLAAPLFDRAVQPLLIHEPSGATFIVPTPGKVGALRNSDPPIKDRIYWMFFANPGQYVQRGQKVTVQIGKFRAESLVVQ